MYRYPFSFSFNIIIRHTCAENGSESFILIHDAKILITVDFARDCARRYSNIKQVFQQLKRTSISDVYT